MLGHNRRITVVLGVAGETIGAGADGRRAVRMRGALKTRNSRVLFATRLSAHTLVRTGAQLAPIHF
jgi:hypothetical protein